MEKYTNYLENKFDVWQTVIAMLCALAMLIFIIVEMTVPVDSTELEHHYEQLETVKQDISGVYKLQNADIATRADGITVTLRGDKHSLKAFFDENNNYVNATIVDNRLGSNIIVSIFVAVATFGFGYLLSYVVLLVLYIPVLVYALVMYIKRRKACSKKQKK